MKQLIFLLLAGLLTGSRSSPDEDRLLQQLFDPQYQTHNLLTTPIRNISDSVDVRLGIKIMKLIALDEVEEVLKLKYYLTYVWYDYRLHWNASEFGDIYYFRVHSSKIWIPQLLLDNNGKQAEAEEVTPQSNYVAIYYNGWCVWEPRYELSVIQCTVDVTWFPYDKQTCQLVFVSWLLENTQLHLSPDPDFENQSYYIKSNVWEFTELKADASVYHSTWPQIVYTLHLHRKPLLYVVNLVIPCCVLSCIAVCSFLLQPNCVDRLGLTVSALLALSVYHIVVNDNLPLTSTVPIIMMYFLFGVSLCGLAVVVTIVVLRLNLHAESKPLVAMPAWMKYVFCKILARCLCIKMSPSPSEEPPSAYRKRNSIVIEDHYSNGPHGADMTIPNVSTKENEAADKAMQEILDILKTRVQKEDEQCHEADKEDEIKNDWMLAAAVLDRICAIAFAVIFVAGNAIFFSISVMRP